MRRESDGMRDTRSEQLCRENSEKPLVLLYRTGWRVLEGIDATCPLGLDSLTVGRSMGL